MRDQLKTVKEISKDIKINFKQINVRTYNN